MDAGGVSPPGDERVEAPAELRTFLIADVRGYTSFTQRHGDEKAAKLAARFASVTRNVVNDFGGNVLELRGDEALCVFTSPRQALRAAVGLQQRFVEETRWDPDLPLAVGIGIDMGEAVPVEGGYRGGALNLAARLCSMAKPGEILATNEVAHLARRLDGMSYVAQSAVRFKGIDESVRPVRVVPEGEDPSRQLAVLGAFPPPPKRRLAGPAGEHPVIALSAAVATVAVAIAAIVVVTSGSSGAALRTLGENVLGVVNTSSAHLRSQTHVGTDPQAIAVGDGNVWVANAGDDTVSRIDAETDAVTQTVQVGSSPTGVALGGGAVWVTNSASGTVSRIDPSSGTVTQTVPTGGGPSAIAYDGRSLWVVDTLTARVLRLDPDTSAITDSIDVGDHPSAITPDGNHLWVTNAGSDTVSQIDVRSATVVQTVHVGNDPRGVAVVGSSVWVTNNLDGTVTRIDRSSANVSATIPVGAGPTGVAGTGSTVWVALTDRLALARINARTDTVTSIVVTGSAPRALAWAGHNLYVGSGANPALHRGGTFTVWINNQGFGAGITLDPAIGYDASSVSVQSLLYDGLVGMRRVGGAAGSIVVPDLAEALPTPTDGGRSYVFQLRSGIRWSTGAPVVPADIRRGLERTVADGIYPHYKQIVGAGKCTVSRCDLSKGIVVNNAAGLVTIHLTQPDPEFLYKLALAGASAVPDSTPLSGPPGNGYVVNRVLPSTGPYMVAAYVPDKSVELVRNPHFHEWSHAARPNGYPDRISITLATQQSPTPGTVDWEDIVDQTRARALRAEFGTQLHLVPAQDINDLFLNVTVAPFNSLKARQAVNYAVDRAAVASEWSAPSTVTCQEIPPTVPGYRPYCPYTTRPDASGTWHGPDIVRAQRLVRESGTSGMTITVFAPPGVSGLQPAIDAMNAIGYRAHLKVISGDTYFPTVFDPSKHIQAGFDGWIADYPAASNFFATRFNCASLGAGGANPFQLCDPKLDARITQASQLQVTSPGSAFQEWAAIDRTVVDLGPAVPLVTTTNVELVSARVQHYVRNSTLGPLYDQMWVR